MATIDIAQPMRFKVDVRNGLVEQPQRESLMKGDKKANRIIAELMYGSETFDITGVTVKGKFFRPPDLDGIELAGEAEENLAIVQLDDSCYTHSGSYKASVSLVLDGVERTVLLISGEVLRDGSGNAASEDGDSGTGSGLPSGGTEGQVLVKVSAAQGDAIWKTLTAADVGARPDDWMPTAADVGARPDDWMPTAEETGALPSDGTAANATQLNGKDADEYLLVADALTMDLLWENASPESSFAKDTSISGWTDVYALYVIQCYSSASYHYVTPALIIKPGDQGVASVAWGDDSSFSHRNFYSSQTSVTVGASYKNNAANDNVIIPYRIYGIKGVGA